MDLTALKSKLVPYFRIQNTCQLVFIGFIYPCKMEHTHVDMSSESYKRGTYSTAVNPFLFNPAAVYPINVLQIPCREAKKRNSIKIHNPKICLS